MEITCLNTYIIAYDPLLVETNQPVLIGLMICSKHFFFAPNMLGRDVAIGGVSVCPFVCLSVTRSY